MPSSTSSDDANRTADRLSGMGTTIFADMSALALAHDAVNLGQGFPDTDGPDEVIEAAVTALRSGEHNQYAPGPGIPPLRRAIADHQAHWWGQQVDPDTEVLVTTGATEAIAAAILGLVNPGDEVVALDPYYDSYTATIAMAGGIRVPCTLPPPDFRFDAQRLHDAITPRTRVILLNTPHNPTGTVLDRADLAAVADVAIEHDLVVVTDEVYEHLVFDDAVHVPIATLPGMAERTLTISSAGKTFALTGWKIGWAVGPDDLVTSARLAKQFLTYTSGAPLQPAIAMALGLPDTYFTQLRADLQDRRDQLVAGLTDIGLEPNAPAGGYFVTTDIRPLGFDDGLDFCRTLPERVGVAAIPHQVFWEDEAMGRPFVRWAFCKRADVLDRGLHRLAGLAG
ncbi:MAG TPA: pyridoxal phosphate-dependent aminotransferase [Nitriliruptoraceae bacterium]|nr:pyridoxal phosphate-dependent aminotransferase [Nitriliruptoraceae bacterium]